MEFAQLYVGANPRGAARRVHPLFGLFTSRSSTNDTKVSPASNDTFQDDLCKAEDVQRAEDKKAYLALPQKADVSSQVPLCCDSKDIKVEWQIFVCYRVIDSSHSPPPLGMSGS